MRADRLGISAAANTQFYTLTETNTKIFYCHRGAPAAIGDRRFYSNIVFQPDGFPRREALPGPAMCSRTDEVRQRNQTPCFLVGHITKDGMLAGPKVLEHMVDTVFTVLKATVIWRIAF